MSARAPATPVPAAEQKRAAEAAPQIAPVLAGLGLSPAMAQRLAAAGGTSLLADLRERFGLGERAMRRILTHIDQQQLARDRIIPALEELAAWIGDGRAQLTKPANVDADVRRLKAKAAAALAGIDGVTEVFSVSGEWDLIAMVKVAEYEQIAEIVTERFPKVPGLVKTTTLTAFRAYSKADLEQAWDMGVD